MHSEILLAILKISGAFISGALGLTALFSNFRGSDGRLNLSGKLVLSGILMSASVVATTSFLESVNSFRSTQDQLARNEVLLEQISRSIHPISELSVTFIVNVPIEHPAITTYTKRLEQEIEERLPALANRTSPPKYEGLSASFVDTNGDVLTVTIRPESDSWPQSLAENIFKMVVDFGSPSISLVREPVLPNQYPLGHGEADLSVLGFPFESNSVLLWDVKRKSLKIFGTIEYKKDLWFSSGRLTSFTDLVGSQLAVIFPFQDMKRWNEITGKNLNDNGIHVIGHTLTLDWLKLEVGSGRSVTIDGKYFEKAQSERWGQPIFAVTFPESTEDFLGLSN